jgi:uncharacterized protein YjbI with pentapeptide repeats
VARPGLDLWIYRDAWPWLTAAERVTATGQFRIALVQVAGAAGAVVALAYTARTYRLAHRGQLTERFSKALERLGSEEPYVRLGGVHALAHLLHDSADHHHDVVEVLVAFVRQRTPRAASQTRVTTNGADTSGVLLVTPDQALPAEPAPDVQAALTALVRRPGRLEPWGMLNLRDLHLARVALLEADLTRANLEGADLTDAWLPMANLTDAGLAEASLTDANLVKANLTDAWLLEADLTRANLGGADLTGAWLPGANLTGADLKGTTLTGAYLKGTTLTGAVLTGADLTRAWLGEADLRGSQLGGANLADAQDLTQAQLAAALGDAATRLPTGLERPASWTAEQEAAADAAPAGGAASAAGGPPAPPAEHP